MPNKNLLSEITYLQRNINLRQDVCDLVEGECALRKNGLRGFSLTVNQIILEYFALRTPHLEPEALAPKPILSEAEPA